MTAQEDINRLIDRFSQLADLAIAPEPALNAIGAYQERRFQQSFDANQTPRGEPWPPLAPSTLAGKRNTKILVEAVGRIPASRFFQVQGGSLTVGYGDPLAEIHDQGAEIPAQTIVPRDREALFWPGARNPVRRVNIPRRVIPARGLIGFTQADIQEWTNIIEDEVDQIFD